jgi:hypothetical protein
MSFSCLKCKNLLIKWVPVITHTDNTLATNDERCFTMMEA